MTLLLALMAAVSALMPALGWAELSTSRTVCACCQVDGQSCPTRSCCSTPESEGKPISPASVPSQTRSDRQMLPAAVSHSLTMLPYVTVNGSRFSTVSFALPPTVPHLPAGLFVPGLIFTLSPARSVYAAGAFTVALCRACVPD